MKKISLLLLLTPLYSFAQRAPGGTPPNPLAELGSGIGANFGDLIPIFLALSAAIFACRLFYKHIDFIIDYVKTVSGRNS